MVTGGNLLFEREQLAPEGAEAAKVAADGLLQASRKMGVTFAGIGSRDLAAGIAFLQRSQQPPAFTWLSANLLDPATRKPLFPVVLHRQVGGVKVAILALTDHTAMPKGADTLLVADWRTVLPDLLAKVEKEADFILVLSNYSFSENQEIARTHSTIDLILQAGHAIGNMNPTPINKALLAQTEIRGKYLGVLDIDWNGHGRWSEGAQSTKEPSASTYAHRFIALKQSLISDPEIEALVKQTQRRMDNLQPGHQSP